MASEFTQTFLKDADNLLLSMRKLEESPGGSTNEGTGTEETPAETTGVELEIEPGAEIPRDFRVSPSGRPLHTPLYDTVQFTMVLRCEAADVPLVLTELQRGSFISVLKVEMTAVDPLVAALQGYYYGERPVVELDLQCEMMFLRPWTVPLMPDGIRQALLDAGTAADDQGL